MTFRTSARSARRPTKTTLRRSDRPTLRDLPTFRPVRVRSLDHCLRVGWETNHIFYAVGFTGGKYAGFGSTPDPPASSNHPSFALSSQNAPSLDDIRNDPLKAASKGWGLFSAAV